jgi:hypothetical protein
MDGENCRLGGWTVEWGLHPISWFGGDDEGSRSDSWPHRGISQSSLELRLYSSLACCSLPCDTESMHHLAPRHSGLPPSS